MRNFGKDLERYLECNKLRKTFFSRVAVIACCIGVHAALSYRIRCWCARHGLGILEIIILRINELMYSSSILRYYGVRIGPGLYMPHPFGIVIGGATIGKNFTIAQHCTIGGRRPVGAYGIQSYGWDSKERITIGDWVFMGAGSCILGPVVIGDNVIIGANSVIVDDLPSNVMVAGIPAKIIKHLDPIKSNKTDK